MKTTKIHFLAQSLRSSSVVLPWFIYCMVLLSHGTIQLGAYLIGLLLMIISYGIVTVQNDLSDLKIDIANQRKDIPLAQGVISKLNLQQLLFGLICLGFITALFINKDALLWLGIYTFLGWLYSGPVRLKNHGLSAVTILGLCYGVLPWVLGYIAVGQLPTLWVIVMMFGAFLFSAGIISLKDFKDLKGDTLFGKKTLLVTWGQEAVHKFILLFTSIGYLLAAVAVYLAPGAADLLYITIIPMTINFMLLVTRKVLTDAKVRKRNGNLARLLFFIYTGALYFILLGLS